MRRNHFLLLALIVLVVLIAAITFKARNSALPRDRRKIGIAARLMIGPQLYWLYAPSLSTLIRANICFCFLGKF